MFAFLQELFDLSYLTPLDWDFLAALALMTAMLCLYIYLEGRRDARRHASLRRAARYSNRSLAADVARRARY